MFIRIKKIKQKKYAYLVKNRWSKRAKKSKQKVIKYLGPLITLKKDKDNYFNLKNIEIYPSKIIFQKILENELIKHGFKKYGKRLIKDNIKINLNKKEIIQNSKPIVLEINEGFLCNYTLTKIYNFKSKSFNPRKEGKRLANLILQSGIILNEEIFIVIFNKLYKKP